MRKGEGVTLKGLEKHTVRSNLMSDPKDESFFTGHVWDQIPKERRGGKLGSANSSCLMKGNRQPAATVKV